jgi:4-oxalocrotonate tautomerase
MPFIEIKILKGMLTEEKKKEMMARVSEVVTEIEARPYSNKKLLPRSWCVIDEVAAENWGIGGEPSNLETLKALLRS